MPGSMSLSLLVLDYLWQSLSPELFITHRNESIPFGKSQRLLHSEVC